MNLTEIVDNMKVLKKKLRDDGEGALKAGFREFFDNHPEAKAIIWTQYAPYFNDGEACEFSVHEFELRGDANVKIDEEDDDDEEDGDYSYSYAEKCIASALERIQDTEWNRKCRPDDVRELTAAETSLIDDFSKLQRDCLEIESVLQDTFGSGLVIATREGFKVEDYDHD